MYFFFNKKSYISHYQDVSMLDNGRDVSDN